MSHSFITEHNKDSLGQMTKHTDHTMLPEVKHCSDSHELEVLTTIKKALACELSIVQNDSLSKLDDLTTKLSKLSVRNTNKKLKHRDKKINVLKEQVKDKEKLHHSLQQTTTHVRSYQNKLTIAKKINTVPSLRNVITYKW